MADVHAHLSEFKELAAIIQRATKAGVFAIVSMGMGLKANIRTLQIAEEYGRPIEILPALGLHPWGLLEKEIKSTIMHMRQNMHKSTGVGEVGLDYWLKDVRKDSLKKEVQRSAFRETIKIAKQFDKPITVHSRGAWEDCFDILLELEAKNVVFHWFSGPIELAEKIVDQGFYISATPALEYSKDHRAAILNAPLDRILIETDSPVKYGDLTSEPKDVTVPLKEVSKLKNVKMEEVAEKTTQNFLSIYKPNL